MTTTGITAESSEPLVEMEIKPDRDLNPTESPCGDEALSARIEALVISSDRPLPESRLAELLGISGSGTAKSLREAIEELNRQYASNGRSFRFEMLAGGWQVLTLPQFGPLLARLHSERLSTKLSHAALETLSIVSYRQPIIRAEIEAIRGVACGEVLRGLLERRLLKIVGRSEELGRPMLYGTTKEFLKVFGLSRIEDLPEVDGLSPPARRSETKPAKSASDPGESPLPEERKDTPESPEDAPSSDDVAMLRGEASLHDAEGESGEETDEGMKKSPVEGPDDVSRGPSES